MSEQLLEPFEDFLARHPEIEPDLREPLGEIADRAAYEEFAFIMSYLYM